MLRATCAWNWRAITHPWPRCKVSGLGRDRSANARASDKVCNAWHGPIGDAIGQGDAECRTAGTPERHVIGPDWV